MSKLPPKIVTIETQSMSWLSFVRRCRSQRRRRRQSCCNVAVVSLSPPPVAAACSQIQRHTSSRHPAYVRKKNPTLLVWRISRGEIRRAYLWSKRNIRTVFIQLKEYDIHQETSFAFVGEISGAPCLMSCIML